MNTQTKRVLAYMVVNGTINPLESWREIGVYRLASRIHDLIKAGYPVKKAWLEMKNKYGEKVRVRQYFMSPNDRVEIHKTLEDLK